MISMIEDTKITRVSDAAATATSDITTDVIDNKEFDSVSFLALLGDVSDGSELELVAQHGDESDGSDMADVADASAAFTAGASDADNAILAVEVMRPRKRYLRAKLVRATAGAVVDGILAIQGNPREQPTDHDASVIGTGFALSPAAE